MQLDFDNSLVLPWSDKLSEEEPYEYPFLATYKKDAKSLNYVATLHATEESSETFKLISKTIKDNSIEIIIVEGIPNSSKLSPVSVKNWADKQGKNGEYVGFETAYTIKTSSSLQIPFIGGEPDEYYLYTELLKQDFKSSDYLFYTFTQQIFQAKEAKILNTLIVEKEFKDHIKQKANLLNIDKDHTISDFHEWFLTNNFEKFNPLKLEPEICAPYDSGKLLTQRISSAICILRDQFTISVIEDALISFNSVLIVYGGSHWSTQKISLKQALGEPIFNKF